MKYYYNMLNRLRRGCAAAMEKKMHWKNEIQNFEISNYFINNLNRKLKCFSLASAKALNL